MDIALLIVRLIVGLAIAAHGSQKLFGWFGGYGIAGTGGFFEQLGWRPGKLFATGAGFAEFVGGVLIALGLGGPIGPAMLVMVMVVAIFAVHLTKGFWQADGGYELNSLYIATALALAFAGFGRYSVDAIAGLNIFSTAEIWIALGIGVVLAGLNLLARRPAKVPETAAQ